MSLYEESPNSVLYRALVIHAGADDLGRGNDQESLKNGNAGAYVSCGLVMPVDLDESKSDYESRSEDMKYGLTKILLTNSGCNFLNLL